MKHKGIGAKPSLKDRIKSSIDLMKISKGEKVEVPKKRKPRKKETKPRNQEEAKIRADVIKELRKKGVQVMRIENAITGRHNTGIPDLWFFNINKRKAGFIELKTPKGILTGNQPQFREFCILCGIPHYIVRSVGDALEVCL